MKSSTLIALISTALTGGMLVVAVPAARESLHKPFANLSAAVTYGPVVTPPDVSASLAAVEGVRDRIANAIPMEAEKRVRELPFGLRRDAAIDGQRDLMNSIREALREVPHVGGFPPGGYYRIRVTNNGEAAADVVRITVPDANLILLADKSAPSTPHPASTTKESLEIPNLAQDETAEFFAFTTTEPAYFTADRIRVWSKADGKVSVDVFGSDRPSFWTVPVVIGAVACIVLWSIALYASAQEKWFRQGWKAAALEYSKVKVADEVIPAIETDPK